jgi:phage terminase small subunit
MALNDKQRLFVAEYLKDFNASAAYKRAGYKAKGASANTNASRLLTNAEVSAEIAKAAAKVHAKAEFNAEVAIKQLERLVTFDPRKLFHPDGRPKEITDLDDDTAAVISGLDVHEEYRGSGDDREFVGYVKKYKLSDKLGAVNTALKMFGKLSERVEHTGKDGGPIETRELSEVEKARRVFFGLQLAVEILDKRPKQE